MRFGVWLRKEEERRARARRGRGHARGKTHDMEEIAGGSYKRRNCDVGEELAEGAHASRSSTLDHVEKGQHLDERRETQLRVN